LPHKALRRSRCISNRFSNRFDRNATTLARHIDSVAHSVPHSVSHSGAQFAARFRDAFPRIPDPFQPRSGRAFDGLSTRFLTRIFARFRLDSDPIPIRFLRDFYAVVA
jgi:hypothetical protein